MCLRSLLPKLEFSRFVSDPNRVLKISFTLKTFVFPTRHRNNILKNGGKDLTNSINKLFNEININEIVPDEWTQLKIKSLYKNKGSRNKIENRIGLFITSIISKLYEKIKLKQNSEKINNGISKYQCGGTKGKSSSE